MRRRVIPSLLSHSEREFRAKLRAIEHAAPRCHIDVADGRFVPHRTWANPEVIGHLRTPTTFGVHLMAREPLWRVNAWAKLPRVRRITVHVEATRDLAGLIAHIEQTGKEVGLAVNPSTSIRSVLSIIRRTRVHAVLLMANTPGVSGRPFRHATLRRITVLRRSYPQLRIGVDIGVTLRTITAIRAAGADEVVAGTSIFTADDPIRAYRDLARSFR